MANAHEYPSSKDFTKEVTIAVGQTVSGAISVAGASIIGIFPDANITGTSIKFKASIDNVTFVDYIANDATPAVKDVEAVVTANKWLGLNATDFAGVQYVKLVSGTIQAGVDSIIKVICRGTPA
jgi:hypothetical protein